MERQNRDILFRFPDLQYLSGFVEEPGKTVGCEGKANERKRRNCLRTREDPESMYRDEE